MIQYGLDSDNRFFYGGTCLERFGHTVYDDRVIYVWFLNGIRYVSWHCEHVAMGDEKAVYVFKRKKGS